eukprot:16446468-Heterocapsa_arctica.AAC.1
MSASADAPPSVLCVIDTQSLMPAAQHRPPADRTAYSIVFVSHGRPCLRMNAARVLHSARA